MSPQMQSNCQQAAEFFEAIRAKNTLRWGVPDINYVRQLKPVLRTYLDRRGIKARYGQSSVYANGRTIQFTTMLHGVVINSDWDDL